MPIPVSCPSCGGEFSAPDSAGGKRGKCPSCGGVIPIPLRELDEEVLEAEEAYSPFTDEDFDAPAPPPAATDDRRPCPMCGEMIQRDAIKCRFCGEIFDPVLKRREQKSRPKAEDEDLHPLEWAIAILCSGIGCIVSIVYMVQGKPKWKKMLLVSVCAAIAWNVLSAFVRMAAN